MKLNKKLELALNAVHALKSKTGFTRTEDLSVEIQTTTNFLEQIVRKLREAEIIVIKRGPNGGCAINKERSPVTALEIAHAVGRPVYVSTTSDKASDRLSQEIHEAFKRITI